MLHHHCHQASRAPGFPDPRGLAFTATNRCRHRPLNRAAPTRSSSSFIPRLSAVARRYDDSSGSSSSSVTDSSTDDGDRDSLSGGATLLSSSTPIPDTTAEDFNECSVVDQDGFQSGLVRAGRLKYNDPSTGLPLRRQAYGGVGSYTGSQAWACMASPTRLTQVQ